MKKRLIVVLAVFLFLGFQSHSQLLWKISGNGLEKPSYLFGTHHLAPLSICDSIAGFAEAFDSCSQLYGELEMNNIQAMGKAMAKDMMLPQDSLLDKFYTPEEYKLLDSVVKKYMGMDVGKIKMLKPTIIGVQLSGIVSQRTFKDFHPDQQLDAFLQKQAKEKGKSVKGFETLQFQTKLMFSESLSEQANSLLKMIKHFNRVQAYLIEMCDAYMKQDLHNLLKISEDPELGSTPEEMSMMIYNRNHNWNEQLKTILPQKPTFIVVGAGHLPGNEGLIELLRKQGYSVSPVW